MTNEERQAAWLKVAEMLNEAKGLVSEIGDKPSMEVQLYNLQKTARAQSRLWATPEAGLTEVC